MLDFATLKISTNQSGPVIILSLTVWLNFSVASIEAEKNVYRIGSGILEIRKGIRDTYLENIDK